MSTYTISTKSRENQWCHGRWSKKKKKKIQTNI